MIESCQILPLSTLNLADVWPIVTGYESMEKFAVHKVETETEVAFNVRLVKLEKPHRSSFEDDFNEEDTQRYLSFLPQGYSFGAYDSGRLVGFAISEVQDWNRSLRVWEFQVMQAYRRMGVGKALMTRVVDQAIEGKLRIVFLETQNTNAPAIRFYRKMGFSIDALDLSFYTNHDVEDGEVAFFMKRMLE